MKYLNEFGNTVGGGIIHDVQVHQARRQTNNGIVSTQAQRGKKETI